MFCDSKPHTAAIWIVTAGLTLLCGCAGDGVPSETLALVDFLAVDPQTSRAACSSVRPDSAATLPEEGPPAIDGPVSVDMFLFVLALNDIDALTNSFQFEGYGGFVWCDPRLASAETRTYFGDEETQEARAEIWAPTMILPTQLGRRELAIERVDIATDGTVRIGVRLNARLAAQYDFRRFPLDRQTLRIPVQSSRYDAGELTLLSSGRQAGFNGGFEIPEWNFIQHTVTTDSVGTAKGGTEYSRFVMEVEIGRKIGFYFWKIFLPVLLIVGVAWSGFWLTREALGQRQRQAATVFLTIVAFQFVASDNLPRISSLTLMDQVMLWSFVMVGSMLIFNLRSGRLYRKDPPLALQFDRRMRWIYPALYVVGLSFIALSGLGAG